MLIVRARASHAFASVIADFRNDKDAVSHAPLYREIERAVNSERDATVNLYLGGAPIDFATVEIYATEKGPIFFGVAFLIILLVQY